MILVAGLLLGLAGYGQAEDLTNVQWRYCYDGDTCNFDVMVMLPAVFGTDIGVRLSGIDAPEIRGKCAKEQALATQAREFLAAQVRAAKTIVIQNVFRDKYFRIEGQLVADGLNLNELMVAQGFAVPYSGSGPRHDWCAP